MGMIVVVIMMVVMTVVRMAADFRALGAVWSAGRCALFKRQKILNVQHLNAARVRLHQVSRIVASYHRPSAIDLECHIFWIRVIHQVVEGCLALYR